MKLFILTVLLVLFIFPHSQWGSHSFVCSKAFVDDVERRPRFTRPVKFTCQDTVQDMTALLQSWLLASGPCTSEGGCGSSHCSPAKGLWDEALSHLSKPRRWKRDTHILTELSPLNGFVWSVGESEVNLREGRGRSESLIMHAHIVIVRVKMIWQSTGQDKWAIWSQIQNTDLNRCFTVSWGEGVLRFKYANCDTLDIWMKYR